MGEVLRDNTFQVNGEVLDNTAWGCKMKGPVPNLVNMKV